MITKKNSKNSCVQDFIPIKDIRNGVIETKDGRYVRILEIEPTNFLLRSGEERCGIINSFAMWLKISPVRVQFKSITRKADSDRHIAMIQNEIANEENPCCKELGEKYIRFIREFGREALTRRFFLIFQYESLHRRDTEPEKIQSMLQTAEQNARTYFQMCGNTILQPKDVDAETAEIIYTFFNRQSCVNEPFCSRVDRVILDTMAAQGKTIGIDPVPEINLTDFVAPRGIDFSHSNFIIMDGMYYTFIYIMRNGYPSAVRAGWLTNLVNAGEGIDIDVHLHRVNKGKAIENVSRRIRLNKTKMRDIQDTNTDYENLSSAIQAGYYIKHSLANNDDLFYMSVFITISAKQYSDLMWRKQQMIDMLKSLDILVSECRFQQEAAFKAVMPFIMIPPSIEKKSQRNVLTSGAASTYMFTSYEMSDDAGVLLGVNHYNRSLCIIDLFNTKKNKNANVNLIGTSGSGKTFTLQLLALRMRMRGIQSFIIAPAKGHEFRRACAKIGGSFIKISSGSSHCINIMEIRPCVSPEIELLDQADYHNTESLLSQKTQQIMIFLSLLMPDMTNEESQILDDSIIKTYNQFGITHDNNSLYIDPAEEPPKMKPMPILGDLYNTILPIPEARRIVAVISVFVNGSAQSFNRPTNVDLNNKYIVFDLSELKGKLLPVGMMVALDFVWDKVKSDRTKRKAVFIDEIWKLIGASSNTMAAEFCLTIFKMIRGYGGAAISATQDLSDFFGLDDGRYGRAIINNSQTKIILNLEPDEAKYVQDILKLTKSNIQEVTRFNRGEAIVISNSNKVPVSVIASKSEQELITTDRAELEQILHRQQQNQ